MKLKGNYNGDETYDIGDVAKYTDGLFYYLCKPCAAGTVCTDTLYWNRLEDPLAQCAEMIMNVTPTNIDDEAISLKTDDGEYVITVDDSGDTPELAVTKVEE